MIDVHAETLFPLAKGPPGLANPPSPATLWRWALKGIGGKTLETVMIGGRRYSSVEAFDRFVSRLNATSRAAEPSRARQREREMEHAAKRAAAIF